ncbi:MAG: Ig-like domain-containing protein [Myxococcales bacterium]
MHPGRLVCGRAALLMIALLAACSEPEPQNPPGGPQASATIGEEGGQLQADGITVSIPAGALAEAVKISITISDLGAPEVADRVRVSRVYHVEPQQTKFILPITVTLNYDPAKVPESIPAESADVRRVDFTRAQERLNSVIVNTTAHTAAGETTNLGTFWSTVPAAPRPAVITVKPANQTVFVGAKVAYSAEVKDQADRVMTGQKVVWSTSNKDVATIDEAGEATAVGPGTVDIIARAGSPQGNATRQVAALTPVPQNFAWENPRPQGNVLFGVHGHGGTLYTAGANCTFMQRSGAGWKRLATSPLTQLNAVAGRANDAFAVGVRGDRGIALRWDGAKVTEQVFQNALPLAVYADADRGMAVGGGPNILLLDPAAGRWTEVPGPTTESLLTVDGATGELIVVGSRGAVYKRTNAGAWIALHDNPLPQLQVRAVLRGTNAWAISSTTLRRFDGTSWTTVALPSSPSLTLTALGVSADLLVLAGHDSSGKVHFLFEDAGGQFRAVASPAPELVNGVWGAGASEIYAVGEAGLLMQWDGTRWLQLREGELANIADLTAFAGPSLFAAGSECANASCSVQRGVVLQRDPTGAWTRMPGTFSVPLAGIGGKSPSELWAVGRSGFAYRYNGTSWSTVFASTNLNDVLHCNGATYVSGDGQVYVDSGGQLLSVLNAGSVPLRALACAGQKLYVVGDGAIVEMSNGQAKLLDTRADGIEPKVWRAVFATNDGHVFAGGDARYLVHWDGKKFEAFDRPAQLPISSVRAMWGTGLGNVFAAGTLQGGAGFVLHYNGAFWQPVDPGTESGLHAMTGLGAGELWIGGTGGAILKAQLP